MGTLDYRIRRAINSEMYPKGKENIRDCLKGIHPEQIESFLIKIEVRPFIISEEKRKRVEY